jgi:uncharacterized membrane protein
MMVLFMPAMVSSALEEPAMRQSHLFCLAAASVVFAAGMGPVAPSHAAHPAHGAHAAPSSDGTHSPPAAPGGAAVPSAYAGQEQRDIKALSPQEVRSLLEGRGMGFAKSAELNGYPGPAHVLELAGELALNDIQRRRTRELFESMEREAMALGRALVDAERELERLFADGTVTPQALQAVLARSGELQAKLRGVHLQAHVEQVQILDRGQVERYSSLRGYGGGHAAGHRP